MDNEEKLRLEESYIEKIGGVFSTPEIRMRLLALIRLGVSQNNMAAQLTAEFQTPITPNEAGGVRARLKQYLKSCGFRQRPPRKSVPKKQTFAKEVDHPPPCTPPLVEEEEVVAAALEDGKFATVMTINNRMCHWPVGDPADEGFHFCGRKPKLGCPYCEAHARKAYQPQSQHRDRRVVTT